MIYTEPVNIPFFPEYDDQRNGCVPCPRCDAMWWAEFTGKKDRYLILDSKLDRTADEEKELNESERDLLYANPRTTTLKLNFKVAKSPAGFTSGYDFECLACGYKAAFSHTEAAA